MKKQLTVALGLAVLATPAFASKARLQALGESVDGSFYVNDNRNVFYNPAQVNNHRDLVTFEFGDTAATADSAATPRAEGGVFKQVNNLVWGLYLGSESNTSNGLRAAANASVDEENNIDLFIAGDSGVKWGANLTYSKSAKDETVAAEPSQEAIRTRFGAIFGDTQAFAQLNITNKSDNGTDKFEGNLGYRVGAVHAWNGNSLFADWQSFSGEQRSSKDDIDLTQLVLGVGRVTRLNDRANLFARTQFEMRDQDILGNKSSFKAVPVVVGLEVEANSWLTLRASVAQDIWSTSETAKQDSPRHDTTIVNAGASLKFGELSVDGVVGNGTNAGVAGEDTSASNGTLRTDTLLTRVGVTYRF